jgi:biotin carboxylase
MALEKKHAGSVRIQRADVLTMPRLLLLLPTTTYRTEAFLTAAERLGVQVVVASDRANVLQAQRPDKLLALDFADHRRAAKKVIEVAEKYPIDAVVGVDDDTAVVAAAIAEALKLPHNSLESAYTARNKQRMREVLSCAGILSPWFQVFPLDDEPERIAGQVTYPCVLKPLSLSASRGVIRADDQSEFVAAYRRIGVILRSADVGDRGDGANDHVLVEGFIPGRELALEGLVINGELRVLALFDKPDPLDGPFFEETIYVTPSRLSPSDQEAIADCARRAAEALGLREGPVHAEVRINDEGVWPIEMAARSIGGLCSRILRFGVGLSLEELILRHALGMSLDTLEREARPAGVMMIPVPQAGTLREVRGQAEAQSVAGIEGVTITAHIGDELVLLPEGSRYLGFIFAHAETPDEVEAALRESHRRLQFVVEPHGRTQLDQAQECEYACQG